MVPVARAVQERPRVTLSQGEAVCVLVGGRLRVCVTLTLGDLLEEGLPVMVTEAVADMLPRALAVKNTVSVAEPEAVREVTGKGVGGVAHARAADGGRTESEPLSRLPVGDKLLPTTDVLLVVEVRVALAVPECVAESAGERATVRETRAVRVGSASGRQRCWARRRASCCWPWSAWGRRTRCWSLRRPR